MNNDRAHGGSGSQGAPLVTGERKVTGVMNVSHYCLFAAPCAEVPLLILTVSVWGGGGGGGVRHSSNLRDVSVRETRG